MDLAALVYSRFLRPGLVDELADEEQSEVQGYNAQHRSLPFEHGGPEDERFPPVLEAVILVGLVDSGRG